VGCLESRALMPAYASLGETHSVRLIYIDSIPLDQLGANHITERCFARALLPLFYPNARAWQHREVTNVVAPLHVRRSMITPRFSQACSRIRYSTLRAALKRPVKFASSPDHLITKVRLPCPQVYMLLVPFRGACKCALVTCKSEERHVKKARPSWESQAMLIGENS
jgi:hypothetical protein